MEWGVTCILSGCYYEINGGNVTGVSQEIAQSLPDITARLRGNASCSPVGELASLAIVDLGRFGQVISARSPRIPRQIGPLDHADLRPRYDKVWIPLEELGIHVEARLIGYESRVLLFALSPEGARPISQTRDGSLCIGLLFIRS